MSKHDTTLTHSPPQSTTRHDGWTLAKQAAFLRQLSATHSVTEAAKSVWFVLPALALVAAFWTIRTMKSQMRQDFEQKQSADKRKKAATRAKLPQALSDLIVYLTDQTTALANNTASQAHEPTTALTTLQNSIEFIDDGAADRVFELVSWYQVWGARSLNDERRRNIDIQERYYDSALLCSYANSLFEYARNESQDVAAIKPRRSEMRSALRQILPFNVFIQEEQNDGSVFKMIKSRHKE